MDFIKIIYRIKSITGLTITAGILITFYGLVYRDYLALAFGVILWWDGRTAWHHYIDKYTKPNRSNLKTHSDTMPRDKSGRLLFNERYRK